MAKSNDARSKEARTKKRKSTWLKEVLELDQNHGWRSKPGYKIFVAGRGAVRFDVPGDWVIKPQEKSFRFLDKEPPDEDACLEVSYDFLPPVDLSDFSLETLVHELAQKDERNPLSISEVVTVPRQTARIVWVELEFMDPDENRPAFSRICVALGSQIRCLVTMEFWPEDRDRCHRIWEEMLRTLTLGLYIADPRKGFARPD